MPSCAVARSPSTSGTTSGTPSASRKAEDLSTQTAPPLTAAGTSSRLASVPIEKKQRSSSPAASASGVASSISTPPTVDPAERADAKARTRPKPRSASSSSVTGPTAPVAPTTPTRRSGMRALRLGSVELEDAVQRLHRGLDLVAGDEARDLDRRGGDDLRLDAELLEGRKRLRRHSGMALHPGSDDAHLAEVLASRPARADVVERGLGLRAVGCREDDLGPGLHNRVDVDALLGERLEEPRRGDTL